MAYIIRKTNGVTLGTILDGTIDNTRTSLTLVGRNYSNYGQIMANNLVGLLENFAYDIAPSNPLAGQLWWDTSSSVLKAWTGARFKPISGATSAGTAPITITTGDMWWNTADEQLYVYNGSNPYSTTGWLLVGPSWSKQNGKAGAIAEVIVDTTDTPHNVVSMYLGGIRNGIISNTGPFTPNIAIAGFTTIVDGYNLNVSEIFNGTALNATKLDNIPAANYLRTDKDNVSTGSLTISNDTGITVGKLGALSIQIDGNDVNLRNKIVNGDINIYSTVAGIGVKSIHIDGSTGTVEVSKAPTTSMGVANKGYIDDKFINSALTGIPTAPTAPIGTANNQLATTGFVIYNSGLLSNKVYQGNSYLEILDSGTGSANLVVDGTSILTASAFGVSLKPGATAPTLPQTHKSIGDSTIATTQYTKTATKWWDGSAKFVSTAAPSVGINDLGSQDGDFWFQYVAR